MRLPIPTYIKPVFGLSLILMGGLTASIAMAKTETAPVTARALVKAGDEIVLSAPMSRPIKSAPFRAGEKVRKGQVLIRFDCRRLNADLDAREATIETLKLRHQSEEELARYGASGTYEVAVALSELNEARAEAKALRTHLQDCVIRAPFHAAVQSRSVAPFETPAIGAPLYSLIRADTHEISVIVSARLSQSLSVGDRLSFRSDVANDRADLIPIEITRMAPSIDPVSQTLEIFARPIGPSKLRPGTSGLAIFPDPAAD